MTNEWARNHSVRFFSVGFSFFSSVKGDPREDLRRSANIIETFKGVDCFLHRSALHPVSLNYPLINQLNKIWICHYVKHVGEVFWEWVREADLIVIDAGLPLGFMPLIVENSTRAKLLYNSSDSLQTIGCSFYLQHLLAFYLPLFTTVRVPSAAMLQDFQGAHNVRVLPHGTDSLSVRPADLRRPYDGGRNAVSIGSMLFDPSIVLRAATAFPQITFHVIGAGQRGQRLKQKNIHVYGEMHFTATQPFIAHADLGIAAYDARRVKPYLAESSLKLIQFGAFGVPSICPEIVTGGAIYRFGYTEVLPSVDRAVERALKFGRFAGLIGQTWKKTSNDFISLAVSLVG